MTHHLLRFAALGVAATALIACSSAASTPAPTAAPTAAPASASAPVAPAGGPAVAVKSVGTLGNVLVAGASGMTVYTFTKDVKDGGTSACSGGCLTKWPALTVPAGTTPTGGDGVSGKLGTITRADNGTLQVTYNGLPLYFFAGDKAPGDGNGVYTNWEAVKP
jgi:predicted lipoprotein with Yx(FWY)xxD motif